MPTQHERREKTRAAALAAARRLFGDRGFQAVSMDELAREAAIAKGGLYHHFPTKEDLFEAVLRETSATIATTIAERVSLEGAAVDAVLEGIRIFMDACGERPVRTILIIDGPSVIGHARWREIDAENFGGLARLGFEQAIAAGEIAPQPIDALVTLVLGAVTDAVLHAGEAADYNAATKASLSVLEAMLRGLAPRHA
ncbi:MAG: helix-turn-helix domain-containing protein [Pseudomonadota bacterium]